jgi:hypothetical protein
MTKYRKKPVVVEAMQLSSESIFKVVSFINSKKPDVKSNMASEKWYDFECRVIEDKGLVIKTLEGSIFASMGDYIIKGVQGEFYPCKPDIFADTYEAVT